MAKINELSVFVVIKQHDPLASGEFNLKYTVTLRDEGLGCQVSNWCVYVSVRLTVLTSIVGKIFWNMLVVSCRGKSPLTNPESTIWQENMKTSILDEYQKFQLVANEIYYSPFKYYH